MQSNRLTQFQKKHESNFSAMQAVRVTATISLGEVADFGCTCDGEAGSCDSGGGRGSPGSTSSRSGGGGGI